MANVAVSAYLKDEDYPLFLKHKNELRVAARDGFRKKLEQLKEQGDESNGASRTESIRET